MAIPPKPTRPAAILKTARKLIVYIHRWAALLTGLLVLVITTSGAVLVFHQEIYDWENPYLFDKTPGQKVTMDEAVQIALDAYPGAAATWLGTPNFNYDHGVYEVGIWTEDEREFWVYVDPGQPRILGAYEYEKSALDWWLTLHYSLFLDDYFPDQEPGAIVVGVLGILLFLMILTGIVVWWPSLRNWALAFTVRWRGRRWYIRHFDLHKVIGILSVPVLFVTTVTGISFELYEPFTAGWYAIFPGSVPFPEDLQSQPNGQATLSYAELMPLAQAAAPEAELSHLYPAEDETSAVYVYLEAPFNPQWSDGYGNVTVALDQYTGEVLFTQDMRKLPLSQQIYEGWFWSLHIGNLGGWPTKILYFLFGLSPLALAITGVTTWLMRWAAYRRRVRESRPARNPGLAAGAQPALES